MQQSGPTLRSRHRPASELAFGAPAASALALPSLEDVASKFCVRTKAQGLAVFADSLVRCDVLRPEHWKGDISKACCKALQEFTALFHPDPLFPMALDFTDHAFDLGDAGGYLSSNGIRENTRHGLTITHAHQIGAFIVVMPTVMDNGPLCQVIGPALKALELYHPRLGQTVLSALDRGLNASCRACTPRTGFGWAQCVYWMGEADETMRLEEEYDYLLSEWEKLPAKERESHQKPEPEDVEMFRVADYEKAIPDWAGKGDLRPLSLEALSKIRGLPGPLETVARLSEDLLRWLASGKDHSNDMGQFEHTAWECCPYLLRWSDDDPLPQIWDDMMHDFSQAGEISMDINSVFAFHDDKTMKRALNRLRHYLEALTLSENLIRALRPLKSGVRIQIPVQIRV